MSPHHHSRHHKSPALSRWLAGLALMLGLALSGASALAQTELDEARQAYESADFEAALAAYEHAADRDDLDRAAVERLIEGQALVHLALGDDDGLDRDLSWLAALNPEHELGTEIPPEVRVAFESAARHWASCCQLRLELDEEGDRPRLSATAAEAPEGLIQSIEIRYRPEGEGEFIQHRGDELELDEGASAVEAYALALGPGGVEIARASSAEEPTVFRLSPPSTADEPRRPRRRRRALGLGLGLGLGLAAVAATTTVLLLLLLPQDGMTQPNPPGILEF